METIRKLILLSLALVVLFPVLSGCQSSTPPSQESSYAPLSDEKITEIKKAWEANPLDNCSKDRHYLWDLRSEEYYYGTHGDCIVIFDMAKDYDLCASGTLRIADVRLNSQYRALVVVYRNGEFMHIIDAYNNGWLTIEQIHSIAEYHGSIPGRSWEEAA